MKKDKMISKYLLKLRNSGLIENLQAAAETLDPTAMFESAHAMKGVCANLGLDLLAEKVSALTEEFRQGSERRCSDDEIRAMLQDICELYNKTAAGIDEYEQGM
jgi:HPt (histidine-containing phosphotransfer) domain-containing protein